MFRNVSEECTAYIFRFYDEEARTKEKAARSICELSPNYTTSHPSKSPV
jgi:hypothetical protein